jgi:hypothetical protein
VALDPLKGLTIGCSIATALIGCDSRLDAAGNVIEHTSTRAISKNGKVFYTKSLDSFDALRLKNVYAPKRKRGESEH